MQDLTNRQNSPPSKSDMAAVVAEIAVTLATMPRQSTAAADAEDIVRIYAGDLLSEFTAPEIVGALKDFRMGRCGGKFAPTIGEIAQHIRSERMIADLPPPEPIPQRFRVERDSKHGRAWQHYADREGVHLIWAGGTYWYMPSEWPPGCDEDVAAQWQRERDAARISELDAESLRRVVPGAFSAAE